MGWFGSSINSIETQKDQAEESYNAWVAHRDNMIKRNNKAISSFNFENAESGAYILGIRRAFHAGKLKIPPSEFYDLVDRNKALLKQGVELDDIAKPFK